MKTADFVEATDGIERVEIPRVVRGELACFEVTAAQVLAVERVRTLARKKMKTQPAPVSL
jgi:hypothetical protein